MDPKDFHAQIDQPRLVAAIAAAERHTAAKIHVYVSHREVQEPLARAQRRFAQLGLGHWHHPHGVLLYLAPKSRNFAVTGDKAVHERLGDEFWQRVADDLSRGLKEGDTTAALLQAIQALGAALAKHLPAHS